ncbi:MAG: hypothetical protein R2684_01345 [Pyrinomonadaceae bacterium]
MKKLIRTAVVTMAFGLFAAIGVFAQQPDPPKRLVPPKEKPPVVDPKQKPTPKPTPKPKPPKPDGDSSIMARIGYGNED